MTCIVGLVSEGKVFIGGDSAGARSTSDWVPSDYIEVAEPKVFASSEMVIGYTTSFRMGQLLKHSLKVPSVKTDDLMSYLCVDFVDAVRECMRVGGFGKIKDVRSEEVGVFLVGLRGRLFQIQDDFAVIESTCGYDSVGCGANYAKGALFASRGTILSVLVHSATDRIQMALRAAEEHSAGVRAPFRIMSV